MATYDQLLDENARLRTRVSQQEKQLSEQQGLLVQLRARLDKLEAKVDTQAATIASQAAGIKQQDAKIARWTRSGKRQAAPFSKGKPKAEPEKPGRKPGDDYGMRPRRTHRST